MNHEIEFKIIHTLDNTRWMKYQKEKRKDNIEGRSIQPRVAIAIHNKLSSFYVHARRFKKLLI
jgi:hypothetical protein